MRGKMSGFVLLSMMLLAWFGIMFAGFCGGP